MTPPIDAEYVNHSQGPKGFPATIPPLAKVGLLTKEYEALGFVRKAGAESHVWVASFQVIVACSQVSEYVAVGLEVKE